MQFSVIRVTSGIPRLSADQLRAVGADTRLGREVFGQLLVQLLFGVFDLVAAGINAEGGLLLGGSILQNAEKALLIARSFGSRQAKLTGATASLTRRMK